MAKAKFRPEPKEAQFLRLICARCRKKPPVAEASRVPTADFLAYVCRACRGRELTLARRGPRLTRLMQSMEWLIAHGVAAPSLAKAIGCNRWDPHHWLTGDQNPTIEQALALADFIRVEMVRRSAMQAEPKKSAITPSVERRKESQI